MPRSTVAVAVVITAAVVAVYLMMDWALLFSLPYHETGDIAANALQIDRCKDGVEIYGNYSRFRFNHPGPAFFYVYAAGEILLYDWFALVPAPNNAHTIAAITLQAFFFSLAVAMFRRHLRPGLFVPLALLLAVVHFGFAQFAIRSLWAPHAPLMPFLCFFVACCSVARGHAAHLPAVVLAGGFLVHGHVAQPLFVVSMAALAWFVSWRNMRTGPAPSTPWRRFPKAHVAAAALLALFLLPLVIDWLQWPDNNLHRILEHRHRGDHKPVASSLVYLLSFFAYRQDQDVILASSAREALSHLRGDAAWYVGWAIVMGVAAASWRWFRVDGADDAGTAERRFARTVGWFWLVTLALCVVWGVLQTGPMYEFNGHFYFAVVYVPLLLFAAGISRWWGTRALPLLAVLLSLGALALAPFLLHRWPPAPDDEGLTIHAVTNAVLAADPQRDLPKVMVLTVDQWPRVAGTMVELVRQGLPVEVDPEWGYVFGRYRTLPSQASTPTLAGRSVWRFLRRPPPGVGVPYYGNVRVSFAPPRVDPANASLDCSCTGNFDQFLVSGLLEADPGTPDQDFHYTLGNEAIFQVASDPTPRDVEVTFAARPYLLPPQLTSQPMDLWVNGVSLGSATLQEDRVHEVVMRIPAAVWNRHPIVTFVMRLPGARSPAQLGINTDTRSFGWAVRRISFRHVES